MDGTGYFYLALGLIAGTLIGYYLRGLLDRHHRRTVRDDMRRVSGRSHGGSSRRGSDKAD